MFKRAVGVYVMCSIILQPGTESSEVRVNLRDVITGGGMEGGNSVFVAHGMTELVDLDHPFSEFRLVRRITWRVHQGR